MVHFNGVKLCCFLSRKSLGYNHRKDVVPRMLYNSFDRGFFSGVYKSSLIPEYATVENVTQRNNIWSGALHGSLGMTRSIHASTAVPDHYEILGVCKNATSSEIKKAYFELAKRFHPDTNEDDADTVKKFQEIQQAYEALKDDVNDQEQGPTVGSPGGFDVVQYQNGFTSEFFDFDNTKEILRRKGLRGEDVKVSVELSLMEAIHGCSKTISFETAVPCEACEGTGLPRGIRPETCKHCTGSGMIVWHWQEGEFELRYSCTNCWGSGYNNYCSSCRGDGVVRGSKTVEIYVEPGTEDGQTLTLHKSGGADPKENRPGDLHITIDVLLASNIVSSFAGVSR